MYRLLLRILEMIALIRLPSFRWRKALVVGRPGEWDSMGSDSWKKFLRSEEFAFVWGPHPESVWMPFHCITLFAAIESIKEEGIGPMPEDAISPSLMYSPVPDGFNDGCFIVIDLEGIRSVSLAAWLVSRGKFQPVCTFDNWPDPAGIIKSEKTLAALLRYAALMESNRSRVLPDSPPIWICERERLGQGPGRPKQFDNRYYLDDSVMPGPNILKAAGLHKLVYIVEYANQCEERDLSAYFQLLEKEGISLWKSSMENDVLSEPTPFTPQPKVMSPSGFFRSSAGGFGAPIPEPSSGGG